MVFAGYEILITQFMPNSILFMMGFYLICRWTGVVLTEARRFMSFFFFQELAAFPILPPAEKFGDKSPISLPGE